MRFVLMLSILLSSISCSQKSFKKQDTLPRYSESQEIKIQTIDSIFISGSLEYANNDKLVIFIAGSGPTDRNCNNMGGLKTDAFKMIASFLQLNGVSSFRYDKRSVGKSTIVEESDLLFDSFVTDANEIVKHFENEFDEIIIIGHSEGALIGSIVSQHNSVISFISISGTSVSLDKIVLDQLGNYPMLVPMAEKHIEEIITGDTLSEVNPFLQSLFRPSVIPYLKSIFSIDPIEKISSLHKPMLIISGVCDIQVPINHAEKLHEAAIRSQMIIIENMGHAMKELDNDCSNATEAYSNPKIELNVKFKNSILNFIKKIEN